MKKFAALREDLPEYLLALLHILRAASWRLQQFQPDYKTLQQRRAPSRTPARSSRRGAAPTAGLPPVRRCRSVRRCTNSCFEVTQEGDGGYVAEALGESISPRPTRGRNCAPTCARPCGRSTSTSPRRSACGCI